MKTLKLILLTIVLAAACFAADFSNTDNLDFPAASSTSNGRVNFSLNLSISGFSQNYFRFLDFNNGSQSCSAYLGKGYCTDYVYQRIGKRQRGDANQWSGNVSVTEGRAGDVGVQLIGKFGHVFVIEGPSYKPYTSILNGYVISEMNFGPKWVNQACGVTNLFGVKTTRIIPLNQVARIWRP